MNKNKIIFIGPAGGGRVPQNGASAKNYHLMNYFHKKNINVVSVDTDTGTIVDETTGQSFRLILKIGKKIL